MHGGCTQAAHAPIRFGEFLRARALLDDEQWLAALAAHWSAPRGRRLGDAIVACGFLSAAVVEAEARAFHEGLEAVEIGEAELAALDGPGRETARDAARDTALDMFPISEAITAPLVRVERG